MSYSLMTDDEIVKDLAEGFEKLRIKKQLKETDIEVAGGLSRRTLYNFRQGRSSLSLKNFIRLLRTLGELDRLEALFSDTEEYSPLKKTRKNLPKRVRDRGIEKKKGFNKNGDKGFKWGDEK